MRLGWASWGALLRRMALRTRPRLREKMWQFRAYKARRALIIERVRLWRASRPRQLTSAQRAFWGCFATLLSLLALRWALAPARAPTFQISEKLSVPDSPPPGGLF